MNAVHTHVYKCITLIYVRRSTRRACVCVFSLCILVHANIYMYLCVYVCKNVCMCDSVSVLMPLLFVRMRAGMPSCECPCLCACVYAYETKYVWIHACVSLKTCSVCVRGCEFVWTNACLRLQRAFNGMRVANTFV